MSLKLRNQIISAFKMNGLTLRSDAAAFLLDVITPIEQNDRGDCIERLIDAVQKQQLTSAMVGREQCELAVEDCNQDQMDDSTRVFTLIDAFSIPHFLYNAERKKFLPDSRISRLLGKAADKGELFRERYAILYQRTSRHDLFSTSGVIGNQDSDKFQLKPVEFLLGSTARLGDIIVLGMLTQLKEGKWYLEDPSGAVQLDLSRANFHTGLFTENCFVLAEGLYEDGIFHINAFGFPPPEPARITRSCFGNINFFGGPSTTCVKVSTKLQEIESANEDAMFVFISDVWLDDVKVMQKLKILFSGYAEMPPTAFIFCGNFMSQPYGAQHIRAFRESLHGLTSMLAEFPNLVQNSRFIFVPGPRDPGPGQILPRPPIPDCITEELSKAIPSAVFATNPCRIQYCTQEIVVFREDIVMKMCRNCVRYPADGDIPTHFTKTILCQSHLCPLPLHVEPIYWNYDNALRLYPLPDLIVCADKYDPFSVTQVDCTVANPGSFPRSNFSFKVYWPATKQMDNCRIDDKQQ